MDAYLDYAVLFKVICSYVVPHSRRLLHAEAVLQATKQATTEMPALARPELFRALSELWRYVEAYRPVLFFT